MIFSKAYLCLKRNKSGIKQNVYIVKQNYIDMHILTKQNEFTYSFLLLKGTFFPILKIKHKYIKNYYSLLSI